MCLFQFWFPQGVCPEVGLLGCMAVLFPVFLRNLHMFSIVAVLVCLPTIIKNLQTINAGEGVEKREPSYTDGGEAN